MQCNIYVAMQHRFAYIRFSLIPQGFTRDVQMETEPMSKTQKTANKPASVADQFGIEVPADVREFAEKSVDQAKVVYGQFRDAAQETVDMLDTSAAALKDGSADFQGKALDFAQANTNAGFEFARKLFAATDVKEAFELQVEFARTQTATVTEQVKELGALSTGVAEKASKPIKDSVAKSVEQARDTFKV